MKFYFQTCGFGILENRQSLMMKLSKCGLKRFTDVGHMTLGTEGAPHDGQFPLRSLIHEIADESISNQDLNYILLKDTMPIFTDENFEFINSDIIKSHQISKSKNLLSNDTSKGLFFTSGGSTGSPKYSYYSYADLNRVAFKLSENFKSLGLSEKDTVANLFMAGNLWSSFLSTQKVLENIGCNTLPIGGSSEDSLTVQYLVDFNATAIAGIPTKILSLARYIKENNISMNLNTILYAGERFSAESLKAVVSAFKCTNIRSAGFATVDCGLIGIQTQECSQDEHILLDEVNVYSKNDMQYISSSLREHMPVVVYKLDVILIFDETNPRKFKLAGRTDKLIQIWGCRFTDSEILKATGLDSENVQIRITKQEKVVIISSQVAIAPENFTHSFLCTSLDVRNTVNREFLLSNISFEVGALNTNLKTGKTPLVIDERF
jgi:phenylacetate-CoA ligase